MFRKAIIRRLTRVAITCLAILYCAAPALGAAPTSVNTFPNIATMKALGAASAFYTSISVTDYGAVGSGGGGSFQWYPASTATTNPCDTFAATGIATGRWVRLYPTSQLTANMCGIVSNGSTDQTSALTTLFSALSGRRGTFYIPYNTSFSIPTVYAASPVGLIIQDCSSINTGQPTGYQNKVCRTYSNDTASDDSSTSIDSAYHSVLRLNNWHTASGSDIMQHSILFACGERWNHDPIDGIQNLIQVSPTSNPSPTSKDQYWRWSLLRNTSVAVCKNPAKWVTATVYAASAWVNTDDGNVYQTTAGGTSGASKPTCNTPGSTCSDGGVLWNYIEPYSSGNTIAAFDSNGFGFLSGPVIGKFNVGTTTYNGISLQSVEATQDVAIRDLDRNKDILRLSTAAGLTSDLVPSETFGAVLSGATPTVTNNAHVIHNGSAQNVSGFGLAGGQLSGCFRAYFDESNTTLLASGINLKGGVNVNPGSAAAGTPVPTMYFCKNALSGAWTEMSRNF